MTLVFVFRPVFLPTLYGNKKRTTSLPMVTPYERIIVRKAFFNQTFLLKSSPWRKERMMSYAGISAREGNLEC